MIIQSTKRTQFATKGKRPDDLDAELGTSGDSMADLFSRNNDKKRKVTVDDLRYMKDNDGTVRSLYQILRMPLMANSWRIDGADVDDSLADKAKEQADFVMKNFTLPPHMGGMTTPFRLVIARSLKAFIDGHAIAEKVFTITPEQKIAYRKIAFRDVTKVTVIKDSKGGFGGYKQSYYDPDTKKLTEVLVPVEKCFLFTYNKDEDEVYGQSAFIAAAYHFDKKRRLYYLYEQSVEKGAMPPKVLTMQEGNTDKEDKQAANLAAMGSFGIDSAVLVPTGYKLDAYDSAKGRIDPMVGVDHHNAEMARSILAQFILLGSSDKTGSFALSKSHADLFMMALRGAMIELEEHFNSYLIPQLIDYNFDRPLYPEFHFNDMTDDTQDFIESIFLEIVKKTDLREDFVDGLVQQVADRLDIDLQELKQADTADSGSAEADTPEAKAVVADTEKIAQQALNGAQIASLLQIVTQIVNGQLPYETGEATIIASFPFLDKQTIDDILQPAKDFKPAQAQLSKHYHRPVPRQFNADGTIKWRRDVTNAEAHTNLAAIEDKMTSQEKKFTTTIRPVFDSIIEQAKKDLQPIIESGDITKLDGFALTGSEEYAQTMVDNSLETYNAMKKITSDDLDVKIPTTPKESKEYFTTNAQGVTEKQLSDLTFIIKTKVTSEFHKGQLSHKQFSIDPEDLFALLDGDFEQFFAGKISLTGAIMVSQAINRARDDIFETAKEDIEVYQYSAILDNKTCDLCLELDESIVDHEEYKSTIYQAPQHEFCRCIWIAIKKDQSDIPSVTGMPDISEAVAALQTL